MLIEKGLSRLFPRSFAAKLMAVAFVGIHVPLIMLAIWLTWRSQIDAAEMLGILLIVLAATLLGTLVTTSMLYRMLAPVREAASALDSYYSDQTLPELSERGDDEVGRLMRGINRSIRGLDAGLRSMEQEALIDPLTSAFNRRGCEGAFADSVAGLGQSDEAFTLFVLDLDNLKEINDGSGHQAGDAALRRVVDSARQWLGDEDWIGRWGGDEFLIGVHQSAGQACEQVTTWMARLQDSTAPGEGQPVLLSAGAAEYAQGLTRTQLYRMADAAMYRAKFSGGRKLVVHEAVTRQADSEA